MLASKSSLFIIFAVKLIVFVSVVGNGPPPPDEEELLPPLEDDDDDDDDDDELLLLPPQLLSFVIASVLEVELTGSSDVIVNVTVLVDSRLLFA
ncbi:MAG: hypothetical protein DRN66_03970 [Candidatus Nanohalarchaeota archaeon]|nr:MAG: hypothetical protein DRN66_03970 [Candidatus Nanohaloarchaeota archaeon]